MYHSHDIQYYSFLSSFSPIPYLPCGSPMFLSSLLYSSTYHPLIYLLFFLSHSHININIPTHIIRPHTNTHTPLSPYHTYTLTTLHIPSPFPSKPIPPHHSRTYLITLLWDPSTYPSPFLFLFLPLLPFSTYTLTTPHTHLYTHLTHILPATSPYSDTYPPILPLLYPPSPLPYMSLLLTHPLSISHQPCILSYVLLWLWLLLLLLLLLFPTESGQQPIICCGP